MRIANIISESIVDGPGLRFTIFVQGCNHNCQGCHNPETHDYNGGYEVSPEEIIEQIKSVKLIRGITLSGGEPFDQASDCAKIAKAVREMGLDVWVFSGYKFEHIMGTESVDWDELLAYTNVLVDGPYIKSQRSLNLQFRGSKNQRLINVPETLDSNNIVLWEDEDKKFISKFTIPAS